MNQNRVLSCLLPKAFPDLFWIWAAQTADRVVIQDNLNFTRKAHINRGKIQTADGPQWIYIPLRDAADGTPLHQLQHEPVKSWLPTLHKTLIMNYRNSIYFDFYEPEILDDLKSADNFASFTAFSLYLTTRLSTYLDIPIHFKTASIAYPDEHRPDRIMDAETCTSVLLDPSSRHFQPQTGSPYPAAFRHPEYRHHFAFEPGLCLLDLLFSCGPESWRILDRLSTNGTTGHSV